MIPLLILLSLIARSSKKRVDVGLGPEPMINNIYHKLALERRGYTAETFARRVSHITSDFDHVLVGGRNISDRLYRVYAFLFAVFRFKCLYIYFSGGPLGTSRILWRLEAMLMKLAGTRIVVMPYGSDVHDMSLSPNLNFKHAYSKQYKAALLRRRVIAAKVDYWSRNAHHIIASGGLVHYMHVWDTLMISYLSIDTKKWNPPSRSCSTGPFKIPPCSKSP